jgi:hypothetical protein
MNRDMRAIVAVKVPIMPQIFSPGPMKNLVDRMMEHPAILLRVGLGIATVNWTGMKRVIAILMETTTTGETMVKAPQILTKFRYIFPLVFVLGMMDENVCVGSRVRESNLDRKFT